MYLIMRQKLKPPRSFKDRNNCFQFREEKLTELKTNNTGERYCDVASFERSHLTLGIHPQLHNDSEVITIMFTGGFTWEKKEVQGSRTSCHIIRFTFLLMNGSTYSLLIIACFVVLIWLKSAINSLGFGCFTPY